MAEMPRSNVTTAGHGRATARVVALVIGLLVATLGVLLPGTPAAALHPVASSSWGTVPLTGGGFVSGLAAATSSGTMYARTDIGGAYRRDTTTGRWVPILDQLPNLGDEIYGVDALAVEPDNAQHVWVAGGRVKGGGSGSGWVLRSTNGGTTWTDTEFPDAVGAVISGNMDGRWIGPRIAVDPFNDDRAYFGTRADGLWIHDGGAWNKVGNIPAGGGITPTTPPNREGMATNPVGVSFVALRNDSALSTDPTRARVVYAAVWDVGVYKSVDGGATFSLMNGSPKRLRAGMVAPDAVFYGVGELDGDGSEMGLWRTEPDGSWSNQDPCGATCAGKDLVALDIDNQGNIVVGVRVRGIRAAHPVYYCSYASSTACNGRWSNIVEPATQQGWRDTANLTGTEHLASLTFAPHAAGTKATSLWASDFYGTSTATLSGTDWSWADSTMGIELTAATDLAAASPSTTQMRLYGGDIDMSGMRHDSLTATPTYMLPPANASAAAAGGSQDTTGIDVGPTGNVYRVGYTAPSNRQHTRPGGWSTNAGVSWTGFNNSSPAAYGGRIAVAADNPDRLVWVPQATTPRHSTDRGAAWTVLSTPNTAGTLPEHLVTDNNGVLAATQFDNGVATDDDFYIYDPKIGFFRATTTSATSLSFTQLSNGLPSTYTGGWPGLRHGVVADPFQNGAVVVGVCGNDASKNGFWFSSNRGTTFTKRTGISCADQVAIGAPLSGGGPSTIYVLGKEPGTTSTLQQVFYSTDNGVTWSRMDRAGLVTTTGFTNLEADPTIPGRIYLGAKGRGTFTGLVGGGGTPQPTPPGAPATPVVDERDDAVFVDWNAPSDGGSPITGYRVTAVDAETGAEIGHKLLTGTATSATISTLDSPAPPIDNGGSYEFRVRAINAIGTGAASATSRVAIPPHHVASGDVYDNFIAKIEGGFVGDPWSAGDRATYAAQLETGGTTTPSVIVSRREYPGRASSMWEPLVRLYHASFLRQPDTGGFDYWMDELKAGVSMDTIANRFTTTAEFVNRYAGLTTHQFVQQVFQNVLGRAGSTADVNFWADQIDNQGRSRGWVIYRFSVTSEYGGKARHIIEACVLQWGMTGTMPNNATLALLVAETGQYPNYDPVGREGMIRIVMDNPTYLARFP